MIRLVPSPLTSDIDMLAVRIRSCVPIGTAFSSAVVCFRNDLSLMSVDWDDTLLLILFSNTVCLSPVFDDRVAYCY